MPDIVIRTNRGTTDMRALMGPDGPEGPEGPEGPPGGSDAETAQRVTEGPLTKTALASALPIFGSVSPSTYLPAGREYVWFQTDGAGTLIDIVSGVA